MWTLWIGPTSRSGNNRTAGEIFYNESLRRSGMKASHEHAYWDPRHEPRTLALLNGAVAGR